MMISELSLEFVLVSVKVIKKKIPREQRRMSLEVLLSEEVLLEMRKPGMWKLVIESLEQVL
jgi:hypothetical protein